MKLTDLIHEVWKDERVRDTGVRKHEVGIIIKVMIDKIKEGLLKSGKVQLRGLFTILLKKAKGGRAKHPNSGKEIFVEDYHKISVITSENFKEEIKQIKK